MDEADDLARRPHLLRKNPSAKAQFHNSTIPISGRELRLVRIGKERG